MMAAWWAPLFSAINCPRPGKEISVPILLEVCVDSPEGLAAAIKGGADRIELCSSLAVGGLTPAPGLMALAAQVPAPVYAMIRPRAGSFVFDRDNETAMLADIDAVRAAGLAGVVLGASLDDGSLDMALLQRLRKHAQGLGITLHRAIDLVPDPVEALEQAISLQAERILTSGLKRTAPEGLALLKDLVERAGDRISIMPGSGIRASNVEEVLRQTGAREVHSSCRAPVTATDGRAVAFGFQLAQDSETSHNVVRHMRDILDRFEVA
jgi:copper homeostasis protein